jgi:hypothetical protein
MITAGPLDATGGTGARIRRGRGHDTNWHGIRAVSRRSGGM